MTYPYRSFFDMADDLESNKERFDDFVYDCIMDFDNEEHNKRKKKMYSGIRGTYGEALIIDEYGSFTGSFSVPSDSISSFIPHPLKKLTSNFNKLFYSNPDDYYNDNLQSVMYEDPEELEFGGYSPLCDTAVYYFIENVSAFEDEDAYLDDDDEDSMDDYDVLDADGLDFWLYCATLSIKLRPLDCLPEE